MFPTQSPSSIVRRLPWVAAILIVAILMVGPVYAAGSIDVTTTDDELDEATCTSADPADYGGAGDIALREAICIANNGPVDTINLAASAMYVLSIAGTDEDANLTGDLDILADVTINGNDATVDANQIDRVFHIHGAATTVVMNDLTVTGGQVISGILFPAEGGGILSHGPLTLDHSTVRQNAVIGVDAASDETGGAALGGGITAYGELVLANSTLIEENSATGGNGGIGGFANGGGLFANYSGNSTIDLTTIRANTVSGGDGSTGMGGECSRCWPVYDDWK